MEKTEKDIFNRISFYFILVAMFILPFFFVPSNLITLPFSKSMLLVLAVIVAFSFHLISILKKGDISIPWNFLSISVAAIPVVFLISAIFSPSSGYSFVGYGFEVGTFLTILILSILLYLVSTLFRSKESVFYAYILYFVAILVVALFHASRFALGVDFLSFGFFPTLTSNTLGSWTDLAVFFGAGTILSLITFEMLSLNKLFRVILYISFVLSLLFLMVVNVFVVWVLLAVFSLVFFVYILSFNIVPARHHSSSEEVPGEAVAKGPSRKISIHSLVVLLVSVVFIFSGNFIGGAISNTLSIQDVSVWPSWNSTIMIAKETYQEGIRSAVLGSGPNNFTLQWSNHKPINANGGVFWATDFSNGVGLIPTFAVTTGILGLIAWISFLVLFVYVGFYSIFAKVSDLFSRYLMVSSFLTALFLWIVAVAYAPSLTLFTLTFFFTGLFIASAIREGVINEKVFVFSKLPRISFIFTLVLILTLIASVGFGYILFQKSISSVYYQRSLVALNVNNDLDGAEINMLRAVTLSESDVYYRALSELNMIRLNLLLSNKDLTEEELVRNFQQVLGAAIANSQRAISVNKTNYKNYLSLADIYANIAPLKIDQAYENALANYQKAKEYNSKNPIIDLSIARLESNLGNFDLARESIANALGKKNNYTEAIFLLSQIEVADENIEAAIEAAKVAILIEPNNPVVYFRKGILHYNDSDFTNAALSFERAIRLAPEYSNAKYFLGLSYDKLNRTSDAIEQFEDIKKLNPENEEVSFILNNLRAGKDPFAGVQPPLDSNPESRDSLPVEEDDSAE